MALKAVRYANLFLVALTMGLVFAHVMEMPGKLRLDGATWLAVQHNLYIAFGVVGAAIEIAAILTAWALCVMVRADRRAFAWTLFGAVAVSAGLADWFILVSPANAVLNGWTAASLPADWTAIRNQWETGHAIHFALFALGFAALLAAVIRETPATAKRG